MASNSNRRSGSSGRSTSRKRVVIGAEETVRVRYRHNEPEVEAERRSNRKGRSSSDVRKGAQGQSRAGKRLAGAKREERERRQKAIRTRRIALGAGLAGAVALLIWACVALYQAPLLPIETVRVVGEGHFSEADVRRIAAVPAGETLLRVQTDAIVKRLLSEPWIAEAKVERDFPDALVINVSERRPAALVDGGGTNIWVVSTDGHWLGRRSAEETSLITVTDVEKVTARTGARVAQPAVFNAVSVLQGLSPSLRKKVRTVSAPSIEETALHTRGGVEVFVGEATSMAEKDRIIREILRREDGVVYINVRVIDRPTWRGLGED